MKNFIIVVIIIIIVILSLIALHINTIYNLHQFQENERVAVDWFKREFIRRYLIEIVTFVRIFKD